MMDAPERGRYSYHAKRRNPGFVGASLKLAKLADA
jgi:hypothetical protein